MDSKTPLLNLTLQRGQGNKDSFTRETRLSFSFRERVEAVHSLHLQQLYPGVLHHQHFTAAQLSALVPAEVQQQHGDNGLRPLGQHSLYEGDGEDQAREVSALFV